MEPLALFPLQLVVYPGETLNLHIFEPRYRQLIADAESTGIRFAVPTVIEGNLRPLAGEVRLGEIVRRYPDGESDVRVIGTRIVRIVEFQREAPGKRYPGATVEFLPASDEEAPALNREIVALTREIYRKLDVGREIPSVAEGFRTYDVAHYVGFTLEQEYTFLTLLDAEERQRYLLEHLRQVDPRLGEARRLQARAELNGHFQHLKPPNF